MLANIEIIENSAIKFFETEFEEMQELSKSGYSWVKNDFEGIKNKAVSRCFGVALFVQQFEADYDKIDSAYMKYREKIEKLRLDN